MAGEHTSEAAPLGGGAPERVLFPLWLKLGLLFGTMVGLLIAVSGWLSFQSDLRREQDSHRRKLLGLASTMAEIIDGDLHRSFDSPASARRPEFRRLYDWLVDSVKANGLKWAGTMTRDPQGRFSYVLDSDEAPLPTGYPIFDIDDTHLQAYEGKALFKADMVDEWGRWDSAFAPIRAGSGEVVGLLEVDYDADAHDLHRAVRTRRLLLQIALGILLALVASVFSARTVNRHLGQLASTVQELRAGHFDQEVDIRTRDEIGLLGKTFNSMVHGLREREFIRETFGRYVTEEVVSKILSDPDSLRLGGQIKKVTVLMSDLRGFTALSEALGPEQMVALLNRYFSRMAEEILDHGGMIQEFTGDGVVALFGAPTGRPDDGLRACACAVAMHQALTRFNEEEELELEMGVGIDTGDVIAGNIGSERRMKYGVVGDTINLAARLESFTVGNQVLISSSTRHEVAALVEVGELIELQAKGKREPVRCYPLLAVGEPYLRRMPSASGEDDQEVEVDLAARCQLIRDKQVEPEPLDARAQRLSRRQVTLRTSWKPTLFDNLKLSLTLDDERTLDDLYAKVSLVTPLAAAQRAATPSAAPLYEVQLRLTSLPEPARQLFEQLLS